MILSKYDKKDSDYMNNEMLEEQFLQQMMMRKLATQMYIDKVEGCDSP